MVSKFRELNEEYNRISKALVSWEERRTNSVSRGREHLEEYSDKMCTKLDAKLVEILKEMEAEKERETESSGIGGFSVKEVEAMIGRAIYASIHERLPVIVSQPRFYTEPGNTNVYNGRSELICTEEEIRTLVNAANILIHGEVLYLSDKKAE